MRPFLARLALLVLPLSALSGCGDDEYGILIRAYGSTPSALLEGTNLRVTVRDLKTGMRSDPPPTPLENDACTPYDDGTGCTDPAPPDHVRIAIELAGPGQFMVHLSAIGRDGTFGATRCYTVVGVTKADVLLVGPVVADDDADGDGWTAAETCRELRSEEPGCKDICPDQWGLDCDDTDRDTNPGAVEKCEDGIDQDCNGTDATCEDADEDTYNGCPPDPENCCTPGPGVECDADAPRCVDKSTCDCDDSNPDVNPGVSETSDPADGLCDNGVDENCDGQLQRCDDDGDHVVECDEGASGNCDCDDENPSVYPGAPETPGGECDGIDNNCNGLVDEVEACLSDDLDGDGSKVGDDCNDCAASMSPLQGATICGNRIDEDCSIGGTNDGQRLPEGADPCPAGDGDGDGYVGQASGGTDCDDANPYRYPGAPDDCRDAIDNDCSGSPTGCGTDGDGDGYNAANDCDDTNSGVHPGNVGPDGDDCDGTDTDCDGVVDEDVPEGWGCILGANAQWRAIDFQADLQHCGNCRHNCNPGCSEGTLCKADGCVAGTCACGGERSCDGSDADFCCPDGCQNLTNDIVNCGRCGQVCEAPACQVAVCRDGVCGTTNMADGTACGGGNYCCGGQCVGECAPGSVSSQGCGDCGSQNRTCAADCSWGAFGACQGEGVCSIGNTETRGCGDCGDQDRVCQGDCAWGGWGVCYGQGVCSPGTTSSQGCGNCGTQSRTCQGDCSWGGYGACGGQGVCSPGQNESRACGNCGTQTRTCTGGCTWGNWSACGGEGVCAPGASQNQGCGNCGSQTRTCSASCAWNAWGGCGGEGVCSPGSTSNQGCGNCGTQTRTCTGACTWGAYGACGGEGTCSPGATQNQGCGNCGSQMRTCTGACAWGAWGGCGGEGVCAAGATQNQACGNCGTQMRTCSGACAWGGWGACGGEGACTPAATETQNCGNCGTAGHGTQLRTCSGLCAWGGWGACGGAGCGSDSETQNCADCGTQTRNCSGTCDWGAYGSCAGTRPGACNGGTPACCSTGICQECCGSDATSCGVEPLCVDYACVGGNCQSSFEAGGTDPEGECNSPATRCCDGAGDCRANGGAEPCG